MALAVLWVLALAALAVTHANPVTLNREQLLRAEVIVSAQVDDLAEGACTVRRQWRGEERLESIRVANLRETSAVNGGVYLLPLSQTQPGLFEVVAAHLPSRPYLIYPATDDALQQLQHLLEQRRLAGDNESD